MLAAFSNDAYIFRFYNVQGDLLYQKEWSVDFAKMDLNLTRQVMVLHHQDTWYAWLPANHELLIWHQDKSDFRQVVPPAPANYLKVPDWSMIDQLQQPDVNKAGRIAEQNRDALLMSFSNSHVCCQESAYFQLYPDASAWWGRFGSDTGNPHDH